MRKRCVIPCPLEYSIEADSPEVDTLGNPIISNLRVFDFNDRDVTSLLTKEQKEVFEDIFFDHYEAIYKYKRNRWLVNMLGAS